LVATLDTSGIGGSTNAALSDTAIDAQVTAGDYLVYINATKTGSPGGLYAGGPAVLVV
jgi:hypothetical protein